MMISKGKGEGKGGGGHGTGKGKGNGRGEGKPKPSAKAPKWRSESRGGEIYNRAKDGELFVINLGVPVMGNKRFYEVFKEMDQIIL